MHSVLDEEQVYRLDHFLGKEATQNLHVLRFANAIARRRLGPTGSVEQVQIDVPETLDIDDRAEFYDATGATLDMVVTHLLQVAAEIAMEPPRSLAAGELLGAREAVIAAFRPIDPTDVVLGQYEGYRDVEHVAADSTTDTFIAARMWVDTERWQGVPFLLRTGKRLAVSKQRVTLVLKTPSGGPVADPPPTTIGLSLQGSGELEIEVVTKQPGLDIALTTGTAVLPLSRGGGPDLPAYATLIRDVLKGDRSLFTSSEGLAAAWRTLAHLLEYRPKSCPTPRAPGVPKRRRSSRAPTAGTCSTTAPSENDESPTLRVPVRSGAAEPASRRGRGRRRRPHLRRGPRRRPLPGKHVLTPRRPRSDQTLELVSESGPLGRAVRATSPSAPRRRCPIAGLRADPAGVRPAPAGRRRGCWPR